MALTSVDLLTPLGPLQGAMWPADSNIQLATRLDAYIADGVSRTSALPSADQDKAVYQYALYKAYESVYVMMVSRPARIEMEGEGGSQYLPEQIAAMYELMMQHKLAFEALLPGTYVARDVIPRTGTITNKYVM